MSDVQSPTITDFLLARIAEDEERARAARPGGRWRVESAGIDGHAVVSLDEHDEGLPDYPAHILDDEGGAIGPDVPTMEHIARWDPARVLAECDAKRRIVEHISDQWDDAGFPIEGRTSTWLPREWSTVLRLLALPYADHEDYREEWRP